MTQTCFQERSADDNGTDELAKLLSKAPSLGMDPVTRHYLVFAWACEKAARQDFADEHAFEQLCSVAQIAPSRQLLPLINKAQPWDLEAVLACLDQCCHEKISLADEELRGLFISLEGGDGSGKSTQVIKVAEALREKGLSVVTTRALGGSQDEASAQLRSFMLNPDYKWGGVAEALLTIACYRDGLVKVTVPALKQGQCVVTDRWIDTLWVYLCDEAVGVTKNFYEKLYAILVRDVAPKLMPRITFLLEIPFAEAIRRREARETGRLDRNEGKGDAFHKMIFEKYRALAAATPRISVVDAQKSLKEVTDVIVSILSKNKIVKN